MTFIRCRKEKRRPYRVAWPPQLSKGRSASIEGKVPYLRKTRDIRSASACASSFRPRRLAHRPSVLEGQSGRPRALIMKRPSNSPTPRCHSDPVPSRRSFKRVPFILAPHVPVPNLCTRLFYIARTRLLDKSRLDPHLILPLAAPQKSRKCASTSVLSRCEELVCPLPSVPGLPSRRRYSA